MTEQVENIDETTEKLTAAIQALIPQSLDDIIRINREHVQLRLATDEEVFDLHKVITPGEPKDVIDEWNLIALCQPELDTTFVFLLGDIRRNGHQRITSDVTGIDLDKQLLITKSGSLYQLGSPKKNGDPDQHQLMCICAAFHGWGFGHRLGVPHFFY
jgi:hypothetical protein